MKLLEEVKSLGEFSLIEKVLAVTNGSVTQVLEAYLGEPVKIRTISQEVKKAGEFAGKLGIKPSDDVNFRDVEITDQKGNILIKAKSWTPLKRLEPAFEEDLTKADVPIGKLLIKHKIEDRREIIGFGVIDKKIKRTYNIIRNGEILMRIEEIILVK